MVYDVTKFRRWFFCRHSAPLNCLKISLEYRNGLKFISGLKTAGFLYLRAYIFSAFCIIFVQGVPLYHITYMGQAGLTHCTLKGPILENFAEKRVIVPYRGPLLVPYSGALLISYNGPPCTL